MKWVFPNSPQRFRSTKPATNTARNDLQARSRWPFTPQLGLNQMLTTSAFGIVTKIASALARKTAKSMEVIKMGMPGFTADTSLYARKHGLAQVAITSHKALRASESTAGAVIPQRCEKACAEDCSLECNVNCRRETPQKPPQKPTCRRVCCIDGQPQLT